MFCRVPAAVKPGNVAIIVVHFLVKSNFQVIPSFARPFIYRKNVTNVREAYSMVFSIRIL